MNKAQGMSPKNPILLFKNMNIQQQGCFHPFSRGWFCA